MSVNTEAKASQLSTYDYTNVLSLQGKGWQGSSENRSHEYLPPPPHAVWTIIISTSAASLSTETVEKLGGAVA